MWPVLDSLKIPRCGLHALRHTHARLPLHTGATPKVVQEQLRHPDPRLTLGMYSHVIGEDRRNAVERVAALLRPTEDAIISSVVNFRSEGTSLIGLRRKLPPEFS